MHLTPPLHEQYTKEHMSARDAQRQAEWIAFAPVVFQVSRLMVKFGILDLLRDSDHGMTVGELASSTGLSEYAVKILLEASLSIGTVLVDDTTDRYSLSKTGWFLLTDALTRVNMDFNHDVNYVGLFHLEESLKEGKPAGLRHFGDWSTVYEGLSQLPKNVQDSWFAFDHFYSDESFDQALDIIFARSPKHLLDVGGNTGKWALRCVAYDSDVKVSILDLPQQISLMKGTIVGKPGYERISGIGMNLLNPQNSFPCEPHFDAIWMSQFLDCFAEEEILSILQRAAQVMTADSRLYIMETLWDRQRYEAAAFCLTQISVYFTAIANGNSKMYHSDVLTGIIRDAGLTVETIHDNIGHGHSIIVCKR